MVFNLNRIVKLRRKGIIILPKSIREKAGVKEGDELLVTLEGDRIILRKFKPLKVRIDPEKVDEILREELLLEDEKLERILENR